jgi:magnesium-transporting ATPase (P-type)
MTVTPGASASGLVPDTNGPVWHTLRADRVLQEEKVDDRLGLSSAEAASRAQRFGPNKFDTGKAEPRWRAFIRQFADPMQIVLLVAGVVSLFLQEWETGIVLILLTLFNAVLGLQQEGKAAALTEIRKTVRSSAADTQNHPGKGDDNPEPLAQDLGTGSNRAGPDGGHASLLAA